MKAERWQQVRALLDEVLEADEDRREVLLAERCADDPGLRGEVEALLEADERADSFLETTATAVAGELPPGEEIGPYRILRLIGEGAWGRSTRPSRRSRSVARSP